FITIGGLSVEGGKSGSLTNFDLADGGYCFRVVVRNPSLGTASYSNYRWVNIPGTSDALAPTSTSAVVPNSGGFSNTLDNGDRVAIDFSEPMSVRADAVIRVTDSDCGPATNSGPAPCSSGANTVADLICGTNASCTLQNGPGGSNSTLLIT